MTPEAFAEFSTEYEEGKLPDDLLAAKWNLSIVAFNAIVQTGRGTIIKPMPLVRRTLGQGTAHSVAVRKLAAEAQLMPEDMALSPIESNALLSPAQRMASYSISEKEIEFCNMVLRGFNSTAAAAAVFEVFDKNEAMRKAGSLLKDPRVGEYLREMKGQRLLAPVRGRQYLEAVLHQVIDRSLTLHVEYDLDGKTLTGRCNYNPKALLGAAALLMKLKGWDNSNATDTTQESHLERIRRINMNRSKPE